MTPRHDGASWRRMLPGVMSARRADPELPPKPAVEGEPRVIRIASDEAVEKAMNAETRRFRRRFGFPRHPEENHSMTTLTALQEGASGLAGTTLPSVLCAARVLA